MLDEQVTPVYSRKAIMNALVVSSVGAVCILVLFILPAEYGLDLTGFGRLTGLSSLATAKGTTVAEPILVNPWPYETTTEEFTIAPGEGIEFKFHLAKGNVLLYSWSATEPIYYDFHGEPDDQTETAFMPYKTYDLDTSGQSSGSLITEFTGKYGWYWRNDTTEPITITVAGAGFYEVVGFIDSSKRKK
jgi:hypothetical protein